MSEPFVAALFAGGLLGAIFFGGLWWTIQNGAVSKQPALWFVVSFFARTAIVLTGFYFVLAEGWQKLLVCLLGFFIARIVVARVVRPPSRIKEGAV